MTLDTIVSASVTPKVTFLGKAPIITQDNTFIIHIQFGTHEAHGHLTSFFHKEREDFTAENQTAHHSIPFQVPLHHHLVVHDHLGPSNTFILKTNGVDGLVLTSLFLDDRFDNHNGKV